MGRVAAYTENKEFRILSAIGIILVVAGHLGYNLFDVGGLFPYYSFHVFVFLFVSGYFYKPEAEEHILTYLLGKCRTLLVPYFLWNLLYGLVVILFRSAGFYIGNVPSLYTLFVAPFVDGHQFLYNFPAWFVPALFLTEVVNVCVRKVLSLLRIQDEWLILAGCLLAGVLTVFLAKGGHVWGIYRIFGRILFMLPGFQFGRIYKEKLEKRDTLSDGRYFLVVISIQILLVIFSNGLNFSTVHVSSFANAPMVPYLSVITGIAFWLRISKIMAGIPYLAKKLVIIGRNSFAIMMHHMMAFMVVKCVFYVLHILTPFCASFDVTLFKEDINFVYIPGGAEAGKWVYLIAGIGIPLLVASMQNGITGYIRRCFKKIKVQSKT